MLLCCQTWTPLTSVVTQFICPVITWPSMPAENLKALQCCQAKMPPQRRGIKLK